MYRHVNFVDIASNQETINLYVIIILKKLLFLWIAIDHVI